MTPSAPVRLSRRPRMLAALAWLGLLVAQSGIAQPREADTLVMGGDANYAPFQFTDDKGRASGFDADLMRAVAARQQLDVRIQLGDWNQALQRLERGEIDAVPMFISPERTERFLFTEPFLMRYHAVFGPRSGRRVTGLDGLAGSRVAVQRAGLAWEALQSVAGVTPVITDEEPATLVAVARGEADYALAPTGIGYWAMHRHDLDLVVLSPPLLERAYAFAVRRDRPALVERLNAGLLQVRDSGEQDELYVEWIGNLNGKDDSFGWPAWAWLAVPLLLAPLLWWRRRPRRPPVSASTSSPRPDTGPLAHLPDRRALLEQLGRRIGEWTPGTPGFALAKIHLQGLDVIEDIVGEATLHEVEAAIGARLLALYGDGEVSRLGPGSLAVLLPGTTDRAAAEQAIGQMAALLARRMDVGQLPVELRSRIGLAVFPTDASDAKGLARAARIACETAHKRGVAGLCYHAGLEPDPRNLTLMTELREAIAQGALGYALQPKLDLRSGRWIGAELLVRWNHSQHGPLSPAAFVPLAEQTDVIGEMSLYLVRRGLAYCHRWQREGRDLTLSVNVSANDLADPALVQSIIQASGYGKTCLMLEVTETDVMRDPDLVVESVARLREHGIRISVDDFGTGHSSLTNLRRLAPDELKIDQSFVFTLLQSPSDQAIVRASIRLGHDLGASVTAEGIEDEETLRWLAEAGCDAAQGYHIARPMDPVQFHRAHAEADGTDGFGYAEVAQ